MVENENSDSKEKVNRVADTVYMDYAVLAALLSGVDEAAIGNQVHIGFFVDFSAIYYDDKPRTDSQYSDSYSG